MELHEWSKNVVNVENPNKVNCKFLFLFIIILFILLYSSTFCSLFLLSFVPEILRLKYDNFFLSDILLPLPNSNDLDSRAANLGESSEESYPD